MSSQGQSNPCGELMCCIGCGRDTRSKTGFCVQCRVGGRRNFGMKDHACLDMRATGGSAVKMPLVDEYHGASARDDF